MECKLLEMCLVWQNAYLQSYLRFFLPEMYAFQQQYQLHFMIFGLNRVCYGFMYHLQDCSYVSEHFGYIVRVLQIFFLLFYTFVCKALKGVSGS